MKAKQHVCTHIVPHSAVMIIVLLTGMPALAQAVFNGASYPVDRPDKGAFEPTSNTVIDMGVDADGIEVESGSGALALVYDSFFVPSGVTVTFSQPPGWNSPVHILVKGDVVINGTINVDGGEATTLAGGAGGPGGFPGGNPGTASLEPSPGGGPGGGTPPSGCASATNSDASRGGGVYSYRRTVSFSNIGHGLGYPYGTQLLVPMLGGSGGGGSDGGTNSYAHYEGGGGGGGGGILIASDTSIELNGNIQARGGGTSYQIDDTLCKSPGSGGGVRLVAPNIFLGPSSNIDVRGGRMRGDYPNGTSPQRGAAGRVRFDALNIASITDTRIRPTLAEANNNTAQHQAIYSAGSFLVAFPDPYPRISITSVAGEAVSASPTAEVVVILNPPASAQQEVVFTAQGIGSTNVYIVLTPERGGRTTFGPFPVDTISGPQTVPGQVTIPPNVRTRVDIWTAPPP